MQSSAAAEFCFAPHDAPRDEMADWLCRNSHSQDLTWASLSLQQCFTFLSGGGRAAENLLNGASPAMADWGIPREPQRYLPHGDPYMQP